MSPTSQRPWRLWRPVEAGGWATARPGEVLALLALILSALALAVVLDDGDAPGSLRAQFGAFTARAEQRVDTSTAIALLPAIALAGC